MSKIRTARFAAPDEARERYDAIIPAYQAAFAAQPWYEVSKCGGCSSGYSRQNPGDICQACGSTTGDEAYTEQELTESLMLLARRAQRAGILRRRQRDWRWRRLPGRLIQYRLRRKNTLGRWKWQRGLNGSTRQPLLLTQR